MHCFVLFFFSFVFLLFRVFVVVLGFFRSDPLEVARALYRKPI